MGEIGENKEISVTNWDRAESKHTSKAHDCVSL